jgi:hypothetical protein
MKSKHMFGRGSRRMNADKAEFTRFYPYQSAQIRVKKTVLAGWRQ